MGFITVIMLILGLSAVGVVSVTNAISRLVRGFSVPSVQSSGGYEPLLCDVPLATTKADLSDKAVQSMCTYTAVRGHSVARFQVLAESEQGVWQENVRLG